MPNKNLIPLTHEEHARAAVSIIEGLKLLNVSESEMAAVLKTAANLVENQVAAQFTIQLMHQQLFPK